ncbi:MAG: orotate phosphoribosyltransferase [Patescibacteria group bacterium]|jgi:orotate phosphoribosyltransferase
MNYQKEVAKAQIKIGAVGFRPDDPITFVSGLVSPIYVDNRKFPFYPEEFKIVIEGFRDIIKKEELEFDIIAGIEAGGIPYSSALGYAMNKPSIFIRKKIKDHGTKSRIEGGKVEGKRVLLVEDLASTGLSSINGVNALRDEGAIVDDCLVIISYNFPDTIENFKNAKLNLRPLTDFPTLLNEVISQGVLAEDQRETVMDFFKDPKGWAGRQNFSQSK